MTSTEYNGERALKLSLLVYFVLFGSKLIAFFITHILSLLAETLHTLTDVLLSGFLLVALRWSRKREDEKHMFGHGRAQNVAALVASIMIIAFTSYNLFVESITRLVSPGNVSYSDFPFAIGIIIASMAITALPITVIVLVKQPSVAVKAEKISLIQDEAALAAALIGTIFTMNGFFLADPMMTLVITSIITINAINLFKENSSFLVGQSPDPVFMRKLEQLACSVNGVLDVHEMRAECIGPETIHIEMHVTVQKGITIEEAHDIGKKVSDIIEKSVKGAYSIIHVDPEIAPGKP